MIVFGASALTSLEVLGLSEGTPRRTVFGAYVIGTLRGVGGRGVGDYTSLNRPYEVLIMGIKAPYPPSPYPPKGPYDYGLESLRGLF